MEKYTIESKPTALGMFVAVVPDSKGWQCVVFDKRLCLRKVSVVFHTQTEARNWRRWFFKLHDVTAKARTLRRQAQKEVVEEFKNKHREPLNDYEKNLFREERAEERALSRKDRGTL